MFRRIYRNIRAIHCIVFQSQKSKRYFSQSFRKTLKAWVLATMSVLTIINYILTLVLPVSFDKAMIMGFLMLIILVGCFFAALGHTVFQAKDKLHHTENINEMDRVEIMVNNDLLANAKEVSMRGSETGAGTVIVVPINNSFNFATSKSTSVHGSLKNILTKSYQNQHTDISLEDVKVAVVQYLQKLIDQRLEELEKADPSVLSTDQERNIRIDNEYSVPRKLYKLGTAIGVVLSLSNDQEDEYSYIDELRIIFYANSEKEYGRDSYIGNKNDRKAAIDSIKNIWECKCEMFGKDKVIFPLVESGNSGALTKMQSFEAIIDNYVLYGGPQNADHLVISIPFDDLVSEARGVNLIQCYNYIKSIHEILSFKSHINAGTYSSWLTLQWGNGK
ncbi:MAG: hypothetical protein EOM54_12100 [Clostridia bacterium]|nr:hypothetical protein [Clostridia bacterium]